MLTLHYKVPSELFVPAESSSFTGVYDLAELDNGPDHYTFAEPLPYSVTISNTGDALLVTGSISGTGTTECVRCLEPCSFDFIGEVEGYYLLSEDAEDEPNVFEEGEEEEFDVLGEDGTIDFESLFNAAIMLELPLLPLCDDDCKGLCPDCGINLNEESCDCAAKAQREQVKEEEAKNPFSVLKDLDL